MPIPEADAATQLVQITFHGDRIPATYQRNGLTQLWILEDSLYIQVDPDFVARYMDFRGAEEDERRKAEAVFECKKRKYSKTPSGLLWQFVVLAPAMVIILVDYERNRRS